MNEEIVEQQQVEPSIPVKDASIPPAPSSFASPEPSAKAGYLSPLLWIIGALFLVFLLVGGFFLYQQTQYSHEEQTADTNTLQSPPDYKESSPTPVDELIVPTVSDETSLEVIEQELNSLNIASPDSDLNSLDDTAAQL